MRGMIVRPWEPVETAVGFGCVGQVSSFKPHGCHIQVQKEPWMVSALPVAQLPLHLHCVYEQSSSNGSPLQCQEQSSRVVASWHVGSTIH
jgi:hypothetical protein